MLFQSKMELVNEIDGVFFCLVKQNKMYMKIKQKKRKKKTNTLC